MTTSCYTMRALANPGPGYVVWKSFYPDYVGLFAPAPVLPGTSVVHGESPAGTIYEVDFSGLPNQDIAAGVDGIKTIDSRSWYLFRGNGGTADIVNGTGLVLTQNSTSGNNLTNGFLGMPFRQFGINRIVPTRVSVEVEFSPSPATLWPSFTAFYMGLGEVNVVAPAVAGDLPRHPIAGWSSSDVLGVYDNITGSTNPILTSVAPAVHPLCITSPKVLVEDWSPNGVLGFGFEEPVVGGWPTSLSHIGTINTALEVTSYKNNEWGFRTMYNETGVAHVMTYILKKMRIECL